MNIIEDNDMIKIHFEISRDLWHRANRYIKKYRMRHEYGLIAFEEYINRRDGRNKKLQAEKLKADAAYIQDMIDKGLIKLPAQYSGKIPTAGSMK